MSPKFRLTPRFCWFCFTHAAFAYRGYPETCPRSLVPCKGRRYIGSWQQGSSSFSPTNLFKTSSKSDDEDYDEKGRKEMRKRSSRHASSKRSSLLRMWSSSKKLEFCLRDCSLYSNNIGKDERDARDKNCRGRDTPAAGYFDFEWYQGKLWLEQRWLDILKRNRG